LYVCVCLLYIDVVFSNHKMSYYLGQVLEFRRLLFPSWLTQKFASDNALDLA